MNKKIIAAFAVVAAAIICVCAVIGIKYANSPSAVPAAGTTAEDITTENRDYTFPATQATQATETTAASETTVLTETTTEKERETTTLAEKTTQLTTLVNKAFSEVFKLPKAPKYIPPSININFDKAKLASYKYDPDGNYYYTDDKDCWQSNMGYTQVYDSLAVISMMYYDTVRTNFEYEGQEWMIQIWKGQYGYAFVGAEVGVYTRKIGNSSVPFACADKEDWLKMEMAFIWDEMHDGNYQTIFNRDYDDYWWCTGFVVGFEAAASMKDRSQFRIVHHITFKTEEMASLFCDAFEANGFRRVSKLNNSEVDTFVQAGKDVGFVWQNINQHTI